jgi:hypothetical protein
MAGGEHHGTLGRLVLHRGIGGDGLLHGEEVEQPPVSDVEDGREVEQHLVRTRCGANFHFLR